MKIALFGATGFTGKSVLDRALAQGHEVHALVRRPETLQVTHENLHIHKGDALQLDDIKRLLADAEVVIHCLGVGGKGNGKPTTLVSDSVGLVVQAMEEQGLKRLICMSNLGVDGSGKWIVNRLIIPIFLRWLVPLIEDKVRMEAILRESNLEWLAVRFPNIVEGPAKPVRESEDGKKTSISITTESAAQYMLDKAAVSAAELTLSTPAVSN